jgi:hypothetical protein
MENMRKTIDFIDDLKRGRVLTATLRPMAFGIGKKP